MKSSRFSERVGVRRSTTVIQFESMNVELRNGLWNNVYSLLFEYHDGTRLGGQLEHFAKLAQQFFFKKPLDELPKYVFEYRGLLKNWFSSAKWNEICDFVDWLASHGANGESWEEGNSDYDLMVLFRELVNQTLERENAGYRFVGEIICPITNREEIAEVTKALSHADAFSSISEHVAAAIALMSDRKNPDFRNSIKESISAVEAAAKAVTGDQNATLGQALSQLQTKTDLHPALKSGFSNIYGYTSDADGIRHSMMEVSNLSLADTRVWTQLHQHLAAKRYSIDLKFAAVFSKRVASLRMSFMRQKKRSTMLRLA